VAKAGPPRFVKDTLRVLGGQVAMTGIGVLTGIITARWLGPHDRGLFQLLTLLPTTLSNFVKLGIPQASVYFMRRKGASASAVASNSVWMAFVMGSALAAACWVWRDWLLENVMKGAPSELIVPTLVLIPFVLLQFYLLGIAQAQERFREYNVRQIVPNVLSLVGMFVVLVVCGFGLVGAVLTQTAIVVFMSIWLTLRVHREAPLSARVDGDLLRGMLGFGGKSYVQTLAATLHLRIDQYLIAYLLNPGEVAYYAIGVNLASLLLKISDATGTVLFPRLAASDREAADLATMRVCRSTLFLTALGVVAFAVVGPFAIPLLYGEPFRHSIGPLLILLPGVLLMAVYQILTRNFTSRAKQEVNILAALTALVLNVGLNWVLIPPYGIEGAAVAHAVSYGTAAVILLVVFVRESGRSLREVLLIRRGDVDDLVRVFRRLGGLGRSRAGALPPS
jgi:O-antigen/teichoic acid export membrane protein